MFISKFKISVTLSVIILLLAIAASLGGLFMGSLYQDNEFIKVVWYGNDLLTLLVAIPLMIGALAFSLKGSEKAHLIWMGTLLYMLYNYMFYLYAAAFNRFFLLYVALFTLSAYALIFAMINTDAVEISKKFNPQTPVKWISGYSLFFGLFLGGLWIMMCLISAVTGEVPQAIVQTGHPTGVVFATDLSVLISALIVSAVMLWKRKPWGYVLSVIVLIKATTYGLVLSLISAVTYIKLGEVDSFVVLWILLTAGCMLALGTLLRNMKASEENTLISGHKAN
jgi:hypothetical protein